MKQEDSMVVIGCIMLVGIFVFLWYYHREMKKIEKNRFKKVIENDSGDIKVGNMPEHLKVLVTEVYDYWRFNEDIVKWVEENDRTLKNRHSLSVVEVDTSKPWHFDDHGGQVYVQYLKRSDKGFNNYISHDG